MQRSHRAWRIVRWPLGTVLILYIAIVIKSIPHALDYQRTEETVARIHSQKLTIENVNGEHLPPPPDPAQVNATVEGIGAFQTAPKVNLASQGAAAASAFTQSPPTPQIPKSPLPSP